MLREVLKRGGLPIWSNPLNFELRAGEARPAQPYSSGACGFRPAFFQHTNRVRLAIRARESCDIHDFCTKTMKNHEKTWKIIIFLSAKLLRTNLHPTPPRRAHYFTNKSNYFSHHAPTLAERTGIAHSASHTPGQVPGAQKIIGCSISVGHYA